MPAPYPREVRDDVLRVSQKGSDGENNHGSDPPRSVSPTNVENRPDTSSASSRFVHPLRLRLSRFASDNAEEESPRSPHPSNGDLVPW